MLLYHKKLCGIKIKGSVLINFHRKLINTDPFIFLTLCLGLTLFLSTRLRIQVIKEFTVWLKHNNVLLTVERISVGIHTSQE